MERKWQGTSAALFKGFECRTPNDRHRCWAEALADHWGTERNQHNKFGARAGDIYGLQRTASYHQTTSKVG